MANFLVRKAAAVAVCVYTLVMRRRARDVSRAFRVPLALPIGILGIPGCRYLFYSLPRTTQLRFAGAQGLGPILYFAYGARQSLAGRESA